MDRVDIYFDFELHPETFENLTWYEANNKIDELGDDWRLPTIIEHYLIHQSKLIEEGVYWSSTDPKENLALYFYYWIGMASTESKKSMAKVRAIRNIKSE